jgi:hypothetical protein
MTRYGRPAWLPWSYTATTLGWVSRAMVLASSVNRSTKCGSRACDGWMIFSATTRSRRSSMAV